MSDILLIRNELKEKFLRDLTRGEQLFFLKKAKEATGKGYPVCEDLFHYCYFLTMETRLRGIDSHGTEGYLRFLLVEAGSDMNKEIRYYEGKLEQKKLPAPDNAAQLLIEYLSR